MYSEHRGALDIGIVDIGIVGEKKKKALLSHMFPCNLVVGHLFPPREFWSGLSIYVLHMYVNKYIDYI